MFKNLRSSSSSSSSYRQDFEVDGSGRKTYRRNGRNWEIYPSGDSDVFARDDSGVPYYARDDSGNEYYPIRKKRSVVLSNSDGVHRWARYADGTQRYPSDSSGDEYYLRDGSSGEGGPLLLEKCDGKLYYAKNRNGHEMIPWNHLHRYAEEEPLVYLRDPVGNLVYVRESSFPSAVHVVIRCLCHASAICPKWSKCLNPLFSAAATVT